jgi:pentatricopeptide repeat protein
MDESVRRKAAFAEGLSKGETEKAFEIARNMLAEGILPDIVAKTSGLSMDEINALSSL